MQAELCKPDGPVLTDKAGTPTWLATEALLKISTHCVAPKMPALGRQARIEGQVLVDILVDQRGKVACVQLMHGHPMMASSAINAAKDWTFKPQKQENQMVSFYGHLSFHFSTAGYSKDENRCVVAHY
jgi:TonB family protein